MSNSILDSSILIDCLRGRPEAVAFLSSHSALIPPTTHIMVAAELFVGARNKRELAAIESFLAPFNVVSPDEADGRAALDLFRKYRLSHGVDWPDCQIAATAIRLGAEVYTQNVKHFAAFSGLHVARAY